MVGPVEVAVVGLDLTERQIRRLLDQAGGIATGLLADTTEEKAEDKSPLGFTAHIERAPDLPPEFMFTDDSE